MSRETERRFLLSRLPEAAACSETLVRQVYWDLGGGWCLRLRRESLPGTLPRDVLAVKGPRTGVARVKWEWWVKPETGDAERDRSIDVAALFMTGSGRQVVKHRRSYQLEGHTWDIDEFHWDNEGLIIAEIEMNDVRQLCRVPEPAWSVREITDDRRYDNEKLAAHPFTSWGSPCR